MALRIFYAVLCGLNIGVLGISLAYHDVGGVMLGGSMAIMTFAFAVLA